MHARKITALYDLAVKTGAPVIGLVDCLSMRLQEATSALEAFGSIYHETDTGFLNDSTDYSCIRYMRWWDSSVPALTDFTFIESQGKMFVNSPNALDVVYTEKCDTSAAAFQSEETGLVNGTGSEEILGQIHQQLMGSTTSLLILKTMILSLIHRWSETVHVMTSLHVQVIHPSHFQNRW